jgi:hypothetical protein
MGSLVPSTVGITLLEEQRLGYFGLSLTNLDSYGLPQILGNVEVAGALYTFSTLEDITGLSGVSAGVVYVKLEPQLDDTIDAVWTSTAPSWSDEKQGWYSPTVGEENQRYVFKAVKIDNSNVSNKTRMNWQITLYGDNWRDALTTLLGTNWKTALGANLGSDWTTALAATAGAGILTEIKKVDGAGSGLDTDLVHGAPIGGYTRITHTLTSGAYYSVTETGFLTIHLYGDSTGNVQLSIEVYDSTAAQWREMAHNSNHGTGDPIDLSLTLFSTGSNVRVYIIGTSTAVLLLFQWT